MKEFFCLFIASYVCLFIICVFIFLSIWGFQCFIMWDIVDIGIDLFKLRVVMSVIFPVSLLITIDIL